MPEIRVARRYASALFGLAKRENQIDQVEKDLFQVEALSGKLPQLREVLNHPVIPGERKKQILRGALQGEVSDLTLYFLDLLVDKRRTEILDDVPREFHLMADEFRDVLEAHVWTAVPLAVDQQAHLSSKLSQMTGKQIRLVPELDSKLIGGVKVRIGDTVMDGSVTGQLEQIREQLLTR